MQVLGSQPWSSTRVVSTLNCRVICPAQKIGSKDVPRAEAGRKGAKAKTKKTFQSSPSIEFGTIRIALHNTAPVSTKSSTSSFLSALPLPFTLLTSLPSFLLLTRSHLSQLYSG